MNLEKYEGKKEEVQEKYEKYVRPIFKGKQGKHLKWQNKL